MDEFTGPGTPLDATGFAKAVKALDAGAEPLWAVLAVETSGSGYLADRRPKILFERHWFHRLTGGRFDAHDPDVSAPTQGGYGEGGAHQYVRLAAALQLDREAALLSASWGLGQIMGANHKTAGYATVEAMVKAFVSSETAQLAGMAAFVGASGLKAALQRKDWATFARLYNGPTYAKNDYDGKLRLFCGQFMSRGCPDIDARAAQLYLTYLGYPVGGVDGFVGRMTAAAISAYQKAQGLPVTGKPDPATLSALAAPPDKAVSPPAAATPPAAPKGPAATRGRGSRSGKTP